MHKSIDSAFTERYLFAQRLARTAGNIALRYQQQLASNQLTIEQKGVQDFVTEADKATERHIRTQLEEHYPEDGFMGEETGTNQPKTANGTWVVDPIDGTTNYLRQHDLWCISIAYVVNDQPVIAVIYAPTTDELFHAQLDNGAFLNDSPLQMRTTGASHVGLVDLGYSRKGNLNDYLTTMKQLLDHGIEHRRHGSAALALAHVAADRFDGYRESFINAWDIMAGVLLVQEAGGWVELITNPPGYSIAAGINALKPLLSLENRN